MYTTLYQRENFVFYVILYFNNIRKSSSSHQTSENLISYSNSMYCDYNKLASLFILSKNLHLRL